MVSPRRVTVYSKPADVLMRLAQLGLAEPILWQAEWQERIVLSVHPTSSSGLSVPTTDDGPDDSSDIGVPVTKKA